MIRVLPFVLMAAGLCGCSSEARNIGPTLPQTRPAGNSDPRIPAYQANFNQVSQGGTYFAWYGCSGCHTETAKGVLNLSDGRWKKGGGFAQVYAAIADRHRRLAYGTRIPVEQLWQITAYVRDLPQHHPEKRQRLNNDEVAQPQGSKWSGPL